MSIPYRLWPSMGFVSLCLVFAGTLGYFYWGLTAPLLDRIWQEDMSLRTGRVAIMPFAMKKDYDAAFNRYSGLATGLLDGRTLGVLSHTRDRWLTNDVAYLLRTEKAASTWTLEITTRFSQEEYPIDICLTGPVTHRRITVRSAGVERFTIEVDKPRVELIELRVLTGKGELKNIWGKVRVGLPAEEGSNNP